MELSDAIRRAVLFPETDLPGPPPGHPSRRVEIEGVYVLLSSTHPLGVVFPERLDEGRLEHVVGAVREFLKAEERGKAIWMVSEAAEPAGLAGLLLAFGLEAVRRARHGGAAFGDGVPPRAAARAARCRGA